MDKKQQAEIVRNNVRRFRTEAGLSQPQLASLLDMPSNTVSSWEAKEDKGGRTPGIESLRRLAEVFERPIGDFFEAEPPPAKRKMPPVEELQVRRAFRALREQLPNSEEIDAFEKKYRSLLDQVVAEKRKGGGKK